MNSPTPTAYSLHITHNYAIVAMFTFPRCNFCEKKSEKKKAKSVKSGETARKEAVWGIVSKLSSKASQRCPRK